MIRLLLISSLLGLLVTFPATVTYSEQDESKAVLRESAEGSRTLRPFTVQDGWELRWESSAGLSLFLLNEKGDPIDSLASTRKAGTGSTYHQKGGRYSIKVVTLGEWTISVVALP
jgi:hypothetical protein